jgi:hypothetical protein
MKLLKKLFNHNVNSDFINALSDRRKSLMCTKKVLIKSAISIMLSSVLWPWAAFKSFVEVAEFNPDRIENILSHKKALTCNEQQEVQNTGSINCRQLIRQAVDYRWLLAHPVLLNTKVSQKLAYWPIVGNLLKVS